MKVDYPGSFTGPPKYYVTGEPNTPNSPQMIWRSKASLIETSEKTKNIFFGDLTDYDHCRHISQIFWPHLRATSSLKQTKTVIPRRAWSHGGKQRNFYRLYLISRVLYNPWLMYIINDLTIYS